MSNDLSVIILAAGQGTRMKSSKSKVLHQIAGREMINLVIDASKNLQPKNITIVISEEMADITDNLKKEHLESNLNFATQTQRLGTADAVTTALKNIKSLSDKVLILYGDTPLLKSATLNEMLKTLDQNSACILGFDCFEENKYGRLVTKDKKLQRIVEFKDANENERKNTLCNSGVVAIKGKEINELLPKINNKNKSGEYYLTDIIGIANNHNLNCTFIKADESEVMGVNSRIELAQAEKIKQTELRNNFMKNGVTLIDPSSTHFSYDTQINNDVIIHPQVVFGPKVKIDSNSEIKSFSHLEGANIAKNVVVGPFARIRPGTKIEDSAKIGNFVEIKKSNIASGAKINHLSYIGDSEVGGNSNIGAGTITCNYDGYNKFKTVIGEDVFIGSNSALIAPVNIGNNAVIGAGSVISKNVENEALAVTRSKQTNITRGGVKYHQNKNND